MQVPAAPAEVLEPEDELVELGFRLGSAGRGRTALAEVPEPVQRSRREPRTAPLEGASGAGSIHPCSPATMTADPKCLREGVAVAGGSGGQLIARSGQQTCEEESALTPQRRAEGGR